MTEPLSGDSGTKSGGGGTECMVHTECVIVVQSVVVVQLQWNEGSLTMTSHIARLSRTYEWIQL